MSEEHDNYRPRSPDLSGFPQPSPLDRLPPYQVTSEPSGFPPSYDFSPRRSYDASPYFSPQTSQSTSYFGGPQTTPGSLAFSPSDIRTPSYPWANQPQSQGQYPFTHQSQVDSTPQIRAPQVRFPTPQQQTFTTHSFQGPSSNISQDYQVQPLAFPLSTSDMPTTRSRKRPGDFDATYDPNGSAPARTSAMATSTPEQMPMASVSAPAPAPTQPQIPTAPSWQGVDVRTKFPVARIKRIMQADEDVGKVAQATPTAVAKALELFMITLVTKGAAEATANNSKRVTAQHLKAALMKDGQYDFLTEICETIPDEGSKKSRSKSEAKSEESDEGDIVGAKKKKGGGRKRKAGSDDESD